MMLFGAKSNKIYLRCKVYIKKNLRLIGREEITGSYRFGPGSGPVDNAKITALSKPKIKIQYLNPQLIFTMTLPLVSVVMAVHNSEKYLREAIESILNQSYTHLELIVIDDGSTDSSKNIIRSFTDPRVRFLENEFNSGIVFTRNKGVEAACGEYIATLDSDDIALPGRLEKQADFLNRNPDHALCGTFYRTIDQNGRFLKKICYPTNNQDIVTFLTLGNCFCNSTIMVRRALAKELKYRDVFYIGEDYDMWCRISQRAKVANLPIFGASYRVHETSITVQKAPDMFALVKRINQQILNDLQIEFSEKELEVHSNLLNRNIDFFQNESNFASLEDWIIKFYDKLKKCNRYNNLLLYGLLVQKWIVVLVNTKRYNRLFNNGVFSLNRKSYIGNLYKRVWHKIMRRL